MRVRVAGMAWLPKSELDYAAVRTMKRALTIHPRKFRSYGEDAPKGPVPCWAETPDEFGIPRAYFFDTAKHEHDVSWEATHGVLMNGVDCLLRQEGTYAEQGKAIAAFEEHFAPSYVLEPTQVQRDTGLAMAGILKAVTGFGKTATALALLHKIGHRAVIVVHKEFLKRQWVRRIEKFLPGAKVGIVQEDRCEYEDKDFIIAMAQSLALEDGKRYPKAFYDSAGVLVVDEVHRLGATTWAPIPALFPAFYRLGLTATPRRRDGCDKVFWWNLGRVVYAAKTETPLLDVRMVASTSGSKIPVLQKEDISPAITTNVLVKLTRRNDKIVDEVMGALRSPHERKLMVLSERLDHLRNLDELLHQRLAAEGPEWEDDDGEFFITTGFYVGQWFTGAKTFSLKGRKKLGDDRGCAIESIYRHFRRARPTEDHLLLLDQMESDDEYVVSKTKTKTKATLLWGARCGRMTPCIHFDAHEIALYKHDLDDERRLLEDLSDKQLCQLAKDYGIAQTKAKLETKPRTEEELHEAERARVIWATYQMCSEGVDIPAVDTLGFATPVGDVEQAYGRGRRFCVPKEYGGEMSPEECEHYCPWRAGACRGKPEGVAFDVVDVNVPLGRRRRKYRLRFYESIGAKVAGAGTA